MKGQPTDYWGKLDGGRDGEPVRGWHPLADHCADVAAVGQALLERTLLGVRLARLGGLEVLSKQRMARLCVLAVLHDIGKFNLGFYNKALPSPPFTAGHVREVLAILDPRCHHVDLTDKLYASLRAPELGDWGTHPDGDDIFQLLVATISHHGRPVVGESNAIRSETWNAAGGLDPFAGIADLVERSRRWFPLAWEPGGEKLPGNPEFQHGWAGLLMLADWLGSDSSPERFPFRDDDATGDRMAFARERACRTLEEIGIDARPARWSLGAATPNYHAIEPLKERRPRAAQQAMLDLAVERGGSVTVLEAETGSGKTEAALLRFARHFHAGEVDGMVFALPTRTAATQIHERVCHAVEHAFPDADVRPAVILAVPGYLRVDRAEGERLAPFEVLWPDDDRLRHRAWAAERPKRYLAGPIVVGTIDQVLLSALQVHHSHLRATALLRQFLVVDEVHASDAYMGRVLHFVLDQHRRSGGHALLLSATLGGAARAHLLAEKDRDRRQDRAPSFADAVAAPYPAVSHRPVGREVEVLGLQTDQREKAVDITLEPWMADAEQVAREALAAARAGGKVLVIRNTVKDCIATQESLERLADGDPVLFRCRDLAAPHHGRFAADDRRALDEAIEASFGKERTHGGTVAVATQTVEQSLDLDADLLVTDLCPMDVLLQRIGRLHRHRREDRPEVFASARVVVLVPADGDLGRWVAGDSLESSHGLGTVYEDLRVLEATWRLLRSEPAFSIPADNRRLVEECVHPARLAAIAAELGEGWTAHQNTVWGAIITEQQQANLNAVKRHKPFGETESLFPPRGERKIPTRLGLEDRMVRFEPPVTSPFGSSIAELTVPHYMARDVPEDVDLASEVRENSNEINFRFGRNEMIYDRLGARLLGA